MFSAWIFLDQRNHSQKWSHYFSARSRVPTLLDFLEFLVWPLLSSVSPEHPQDQNRTQAWHLAPSSPAFLFAVNCFSSPDFFPSLMWGRLMAPPIPRTLCLSEPSRGLPTVPERPALTHPLLVCRVNSAFPPHATLSHQREVTSL